jgi:hypothetical protein
MDQLAGIQKPGIDRSGEVDIDRRMGLKVPTEVHIDQCPPNRFYII